MGVLLRGSIGHNFALNPKALQPKTSEDKVPRLYEIHKGFGNPTLCRPMFDKPFLLRALIFGSLLEPLLRGGGFINQGSGLSWSFW